MSRVLGSWYSARASPSGRFLSPCRANIKLRLLSVAHFEWSHSTVTCSDEQHCVLENAAKRSAFLQRLSIRVVNEDYRFSFELVAAVNPRLMTPISFQCRFSMGLISI